MYDLIWFFFDLIYINNMVYYSYYYYYYVYQYKMIVGMWKECWNIFNVEFYNLQLNELFVKYYQRMLIRLGMWIFVFLCGKVVEMKWLLDYGYKVVGLEVVFVFCKVFFEENGIFYNVKEMKGIYGEKYESFDQKIVIYSCDFFFFIVDICGEFDGIWDCGGLNFMDVEDREVYIYRICILMGKGCVNLIEFVNFDKFMVDIIWSMIKEELQKVFGEGFIVEDFNEMKVL